jgi:citrate synthase
MFIHEKIAEQLPAWRERVMKLIKEKGDVVIDKVTIDQIYGGMRGSMVLVSDISYVDPAEGIRFRGFSIPEVLKLLPKPDQAETTFF